MKRMRDKLVKEMEALEKDIEFMKKMNILVGLSGKQKQLKKIYEKFISISEVKEKYEELIKEI